MFSAIGRLISGIWRWFTGLFAFRAPEHERRGGVRSTARVTWRAGTILFILGFIAWNVDFVWATLGTRNYSLAYPKQTLQPAATAAVSPPGQPEAEPPPAAPAEPEAAPGAPGTPVAGEPGRCHPSKLVEMQAYLIDFLVNQNRWVPSMPQYKAGVLGIWSWEDTPLFDNKAAFQLGVLSALQRTGVELTDILGRTRGTSAADADLQAAQAALQTDARTWYFNPFDRQRPFGPTTATPTYYRQAMRNYIAFNDRLEKCQATFDVRADNLLQFLERVAADVGSTIDILGKRSQGERYDPRTDEFVTGEGNDRGWFDFRADDLFMFASGKMYAYHGLLQAARADFAGVIQRRDIGAVWDLMEEHVAEAAALSPLIVSNGREDGALMPDHLAVLSQKMLRARANMSEIRDILTR